MDQRIQYTQTEDGLSIAYSEMGEGPPLIYLPNPPISNLELELQLTGFGDFINELAKHFRLIRYDSRAAGLSDRSLENYSIDGLLLDLRAVVKATDLDSFSMIAPSNGTPTAISYAASEPDRVSRLAIINGWVRDGDWASSPELKSLRGMFDQDWKTYTETYARVALGWESDQAPKYAALIRESTSPDAIREWTARGRRMDASDLLGKVQCPTLVLATRNFGLLEPDVSRRIASGIPKAQLVLLEEDEHIHTGKSEPMLAAIKEFLGAGETADSAEPRGRFQTILFTDVEGSTALTERLGDAKARELLREHERITREALKEHGGSEVKTMGDGFMASFSSATGALECAVALQKAFAERNSSLRSQGSPLRPGSGQASTGSGRTDEIRIRIGLNAGEPIAEDDPGGRADLFGTAVNMAARIAAQAEGGEILASNVVRELVAGKGFLFNDRGEAELRGFEDPVRVYEVRWGDRG